MHGVEKAKKPLKPSPFQNFFLNFAIYMLKLQCY